MNHSRLYLSVVLTAVLMVIAQFLSMSALASTDSGELPAVPDEIAVPAGSVLMFSSHARGVQIYECQNGQWVFHAPRALLFDPETLQPIANHYGGIDRDLTPGPWWDSIADSSRIRAASTGSAASPNPDSIPQLRLKVMERQGSGMFTPATFIQRLNTTGGVGPTGACQTGAQRSVPYTADYYFYTTP